jgi:hypothetical protein
MDAFAVGENERKILSRAAAGGEGFFEKKPGRKPR